MNALELRAVGWYCKDRQLKPQLSTPPTMYFKDKDGNEVRTDLVGIVTEYKQWKTEDSKERARQKRADAQRIKRPRVI